MSSPEGLGTRGREDSEKSKKMGNIETFAKSELRRTENVSDLLERKQV